MTLWREPVEGDTLRNKISGVSFIFNKTVAKPSHYWYRREDYEFVTITPIEPPPVPLRRTVYIPVYKTKTSDKLNIVPGPAVMGGSTHTWATTGEDAKRRTSGFEHRVGIIKVELVEGQYDE